MKPTVLHVQFWMMYKMINKGIHINGSYHKDFTLTLFIHAELENVFDAWTNAGKVKLWWGPHHFTNPVCELDARTGGRFHIVMNAPDGLVFLMKGIFHQVEYASKLVFTTTAFEDENGNSPLEYLNTVTFKNDGANTILQMNAEIMRSAPGIDCLVDGIKEGWQQSFEKLEMLLQQ